MNRKWIPLAILTILAVSSLAVVQEPPAVTGGEINLGDTAWLLTATGLVLLMTPGLSFFYAGMVSTKNVISTMLQSFIALGVITLVWIAVGFSLCFGDSINGLIGDPRTYFMFRGVGGTAHPDLAPTIPSSSSRCSS
jgi:Amt family ammonium transporter